MNHQKVYEAIITKAKSENRKKLKKIDIEYEYYLNHHILPRCMGGCNEKENMQLLTAKEHIVCHKLLTYIYPHHKGIAWAFHMMSFSKKYNKYVSSRDYAYTKEHLSLIPMSEETKQKMRKPHKPHNISIESHEKMVWNNKHRSQEVKDKLGWSRGKKVKPCSKETKLKLSIANKDKKRTDEFKEQMRIIALNRPPDSDETKFKKGNAMRNKKHKPETIEKMKNTEHNISSEGRLNLSLANKGKTRSKETIEKIKKSLAETRNKNKLKLFMRITDKYVFFWGSFLSNWIPMNLEIEYLGKKFNTSEQLFMYIKAKTFNDHKIAHEILTKGQHPKDAKNLGRKVSNYDDEVWAKYREEAMYKAIYAKFSQYPDLRKQLLDTGDKILVEGTPFDPIWGVMIKWDDDRILDEKNWRGQNLLGKILMNVRKNLIR